MNGLSRLVLLLGTKAWNRGQRSWRKRRLSPAGSRSTRPNPVWASRTEYVLISVISEACLRNPDLDLFYLQQHGLENST